MMRLRSKIAQRREQGILDAVAGAAAECKSLTSDFPHL